MIHDSAAHAARPRWGPGFRAVRFGVFFVAIALAGCGSDSGPLAGPAPVEPPDLLGNPDAGEVAFRDNCASCHSSRDGVDLAVFEFNEFDIVRRGLAHVDSATARDIAAHIKRLDVESMRRHVPPFQPGGKIRGNRPYFATAQPDEDMAFWVDVFGTTGFPFSMTRQALLAIDPRDHAVPLAMPVWSLEGSNEDWMPDGPLPAELLDADGGALRSAIAEYYRAPTESNLIEAMERFREVSVGAGRMCWRADPFPCFDARRWMSSLGAQHYLRSGGEVRVPAEVAQLWWDVGESEIALQAVSRNREERDAAFRSGSRWMYLAYSHAPDAFREPAGYMGTFLRSQGLNRVSLFAALRRMVGDGPVHAEHPDQVLEDARLAVRRSDFEVGANVVEFVLFHVVEHLRHERHPALDVVGARAILAETWDAARAYRSNSAQWTRISDLHDQAVALLH